MSNINQTETAKLPESLVAKIFDATGTKRGGGRGFIMFYVNEDGSVSSVEKFEQPYIKSALVHTMEQLYFRSL